MQATQGRGLGVEGQWEEGVMGSGHSIAYHFWNQSDKGSSALSVWRWAGPFLV